MNVRLVACDVDGTLLRSDGTLSPRTAAAMEAAETAGLVVVLATGRPPREMHDLAHFGIAVCSNGTTVHDLHTDTTVAAFGFDLAVADDIRDALLAAMPDLELDHEVAAGTVIQLVARHPELSAVELFAAAHAAIPDLPARAAATYWPEGRLLELFATGVSKASALERIAESLGITAGEVIAFGDRANDIPMLAWAGHAVAMANAEPDVQAIADEVTLSNDEDGVAVVVERLLATPPR